MKQYQMESVPMNAMRGNDAHNKKINERMAAMAAEGWEVQTLIVPESVGPAHILFVRDAS